MLKYNCSNAIINCKYSYICIIKVEINKIMEKIMITLSISISILAIHVTDAHSVQCNYQS